MLICSRGHVVLMPDFSLPLEYYLIPFLIIVGICLILIVVFMVDKDVSASASLPRIFECRYYLTVLQILVFLSSLEFTTPLHPPSQVSVQKKKKNWIQVGLFIRCLSLASNLGSKHHSFPHVTVLLCCQESQFLFFGLTMSNLKPARFCCLGPNLNFLAAINRNGDSQTLLVTT